MHCVIYSNEGGWVPHALHMHCIINSNGGGWIHMHWVIYSICTNMIQYIPGTSAATNTTLCPATIDQFHCHLDNLLLTLEEHTI